MPRYRVLVDDNFRGPVEEAQAPGRWEYGIYDTLEEAVAACRHLVDRSLRFSWFSLGDADGRIYMYRAFGDDPFIVVEGAEPAEHTGPLFSAWDYAEARCNALPLTRLKRWWRSKTTKRSA